MQYTTQPVQLTLPTFEAELPQVPLIDRLYSWLIDRAERYHSPVITGSNRTAADELGCSPGAIPRLMRQLVGLGRIAVEKVGKFHQIHVLVAAWWAGDRADGVIDHSIRVIDHTPMNKVLRDHDQEEVRAPAKTPSESPAASDPRFVELEQDHGININPAVAPEIVQAQQRRPWNVADIVRDVQLARQRGKGVGYVIQTWRNGRRLADVETETSDGRPATTDQPERSAHSPQYNRPYGNKRPRANRQTGEIHIKRSWSCDTPGY